MKTIASTPLIGGTLEFKPVMKIRGKFMVPAYQRGYRWGEELGETPPWTMEFETRPSSTDFIGDPCAARAGENIDFHHIFTAHKTIVRRLDSLNSRDREAMHEALKERVQVIWYEASADAQSVELFTRLNSGRIQLDDAELFKALLLSRLLAGDERETADATDHLRANEVAVQWDSIERDLRRRNLWAFLAANRTCATHISLLLEIVADVRARDAAGSFRVFHALREKVEKGTAGEVWARVVSLHERALGWYADLEQFHKIGFLIAQAGGEARDEVLRKVATTAAHETRTAFRAWLTNQIRKELGVSDTELDTLRYDKDRTRAQRLLLLMNVETMGRMNVETKGQQLNREARYPFAAHHTLRWSVEHIHAQQAPELNRIKQWQAWIDEHKPAVEAVPDTDDRKALLDRIKLWTHSTSSRSPSGPDFKDLARSILTFLAAPDDEGSDDEMHGLGNLALLSSEENTRLGNSAFEMKRRKIIEEDRKGAYIPICTRNVFLKYYSDPDGLQPHYWSARDRKTYLAQIRVIIGEYLKKEAHS